ncbi:MAG: hypothetical protein H0X26_00550 [Alphaproteobacteria bacterium]|nr:hypothetical protein [Alphaproteobacteria bacterium]
MKKILICSSLMALWGISAEALEYVNTSTDPKNKAAGEDVTFTFDIAPGAKIDDFTPTVTSLKKGERLPTSLNPVLFEKMRKQPTNLQYITITVKAPPGLIIPCTVNNISHIPINQQGWIKLYKSDAIFTYDLDNYTASKCVIQYN